jgi:hypothetical protein
VRKRLGLVVSGERLVVVVVDSAVPELWMELRGWGQADLTSVIVQHVIR